MGQPLQLNSPDMKSRHLSVVIYWKQRRGIDALQNGHAALIIDFAEFHPMFDDFYVSWLGGGGGTIFKQRAANATFADDAQQWGGQAVGNQGYHVPTHWVALHGLNVGAMKTAWDAMKSKQAAHWKIFDKNCATTVARILKAGGGDNYATRHKEQMVWWPTDLLRYAKSMGPNVFRTS